MATQSALLPALLKGVLSDSLPQCSDGQLLERFIESSDETAFAAILQRHGPMLLSLCRRMVNDVHLADDVLQATFLTLARKADSIRRRDSLASWLYGTAQRVARRALLAEAARGRRERRAAANREEAVKGDPGWGELLNVLDEELQRLPERYRLPLLLCYLEGRTQDEAAMQLGWSLSTLRRRLARGRELLRTRMTRRCATLGAGLLAGLLTPSAVRATLTAELQKTVLATALAAEKGAGVPVSVAVLANEGVRITTLTKIFTWAALALTIGFVSSTVWQTAAAVNANNPKAKWRPSKQVHRKTTVTPQAPVVRRDWFDDQLPSGALARLGAVAFRHGRINYGASLTFASDGKHLISSGGGWVRRWNLATGNETVNVGNGWRSGYGFDLVAPDGKIARVCMNVPTATGGYRWECQEFDLEGGKEQRRFRLEFPRNTGDGHALPGYASPDGKTLAELNDSGKLTLWAVSTGKVTHHIKQNGVAYMALAFTPKGNNVVVGDDTHTFRVFNTVTGKEQRSFGPLRGNAVARMAISPDGKWLVTAGGKKRANPRIWPHDRFLRLWNLKQGELVRTIEFPEDQGVRSLVFTRDSRTVVAALQGGKSGVAVRSWDAASGKPRQAWTTDPVIGLTLATSPDGKTLATLNNDGVIRLWDMKTGKEKQAMAASTCALNAVCFRPTGKTLLTIGSDGAMREWNAATGRLLGSIRGRVNGYHSAFTTGKKHLLTYSRKDSKIRLKDLATGKLVMTQPGVLAVVSADEKRVAILDTDRSIRVIDVATQKLIRTWTPGKRDSDWPHSPVPRGFSPDGKSLFLQGESLSMLDVRTGKEKILWSLLTNKVLLKPKDRRRNSWERIESMAVSPDGGKVAFCLLKDQSQRRRLSYFCRVMLFETMTGKLLHQADIDEETVGPVTFGPHGKLLAAGGPWGVRVWDVAAAKEFRKFEGHRGRVQSLAFTPDGKRLASASVDSTVLVWDVSR